GARGTDDPEGEPAVLIGDGPGRELAVVGEPARDAHAQLPDGERREGRRLHVEVALRDAAGDDGAQGVLVLATTGLEVAARRLLEAAGVAVDHERLAAVRGVAVGVDLGG